jgi:eukaryotic-like serine/threonine-protein kinase
MSNATPPDETGDWVRTAHLGEGHWCECFLARPRNCPDDWPNDYVVKQLKPVWKSDPMAAALLRREAEIGREVTHPNLIALLAANLNTGTPHLVFPYLRGASARQILESEQQVPISYAVWIVRQASEAVQAIHQAGYRHGDIQPDNLLISPNWHVTVIDLGLARAKGEDANDHQRWLTGTRGYAAPEFIASPASIGPAADVYSLGATLYELVTGLRPDQSELGNQREQPGSDFGGHGRFIDMKQLCPVVGTELARLSREMLAITPGHRPSLVHLIARLRRLEMFHLADRSTFAATGSRVA